MVYLFVYFVGAFFSLSHCMWKFPGQVLNTHHSSNSSIGSDNTGSLIHCATRELQNFAWGFSETPKPLETWQHADLRILSSAAHHWLMPHLYSWLWAAGRVGKGWIQINTNPGRGRNPLPRPVHYLVDSDLGTPLRETTTLPWGAWADIFPLSLPYPKRPRDFNYGN